jgi:ABC-type Fe3+/spermidine/putrescine transport system ATPase subunit
MEIGIEIKNISKTYGKRRVLADVSFSVPAGGSTALLGASGSGKTTLLSILAGLERPDAGEVWLLGRRICGAGDWVPPHLRGLSLVFQQQALWPHMTVKEHLDFVLRAQKTPRKDRTRLIASQLEAVCLTGRDRDLPSRLSGGEAQRLALARALVSRPQALLLDEPCANLDANLRRTWLDLFNELRRKLGFTAVYVTHDALEAFAVAENLIVLDEGRIAQQGLAEEVYKSPSGKNVERLMAVGIEPPTWWKA